MKAKSFAFFALSALLTSTAFAGVETQLVDALRQGGFACKLNDAGDGFVCKDRANVYVLVPKNLVKHERNVFYAHGDTGVCGPGASGENFLRDQMPALFRNNAVAVLPLREPSRDFNFPFGALMNRIDGILKSGELPITVSGHSWGGKLLPRLLNANPALLRRVDKALLLDVGYDVDSLLLPPWKKSLGQNPKLKIRAISSTTFQKMEHFKDGMNEDFPGSVTNKKVNADHCPTAAYFREL